MRAVSESVMREIIAATPLAPILNRDRGPLRTRPAKAFRKRWMNMKRHPHRPGQPGPCRSAGRGDRKLPPGAGAEQERDRLERQADAYSNRVLAEARGTAAQILEQAEAYRAQTINNALGEASRFTAVLAEYQNAEEVTRRRIYLETMEQYWARRRRSCWTRRWLVAKAGRAWCRSCRWISLIRNAIPAPRPQRRGAEAMSRLVYLLIAAAVVVVGLSGSLFVVNERQTALVLQFGQIRQVVSEPGLGFKIPFIQ